MTNLSTQNSSNLSSETLPNSSDQALFTSEISSMLKQLKFEELLVLAKVTTELKKRPKTLGPQTDDELHKWIKDNLGYDIPRQRVCPDHASPFEFLADVYFERVTSAIAVANRGGSKTMISAILHLLNS